MHIQSTHGTPKVKKPTYAGPVSKIKVPTHGGPRIAHYTTVSLVVSQQNYSAPTQRYKAARKPIHSVSLYVLVVLVLSSFGFGVWFTWSTHNSQAGEPQAESAVVESPPGPIPIQSNAPLLAESDKVSDQNVLTMTMEQLENYLQVATTTPEKQAAETKRLRAIQLKAYLESKGSPLALFADTIAGLKHWRLVLAISNSESSLGRRCANNNCSGIGVMPGHPLWRTYETKAEWAKDLDRLIEKRYKNWSLEKMNGVYNQPGSENWVYAARQILDDIQSIP